MTKIALIVPYRFVPPRNGGHKAAFGFASAIAHQANFAVLSTDNNDPGPGFRLIPSFPDHPSKYVLLRYRNRIKAVLRREGISHVILFQHYQAALLLPALKRMGISASIYVQNIEYQRWRSLGKWWWPLMRVYEAWAYRRADRLFFISPEDRTAAPGLFGIPVSKCDLVDYGIRRPETGEVASARLEIAARHGIQPGEKIILFFGPQHYKPNQDAVLRIARQIIPALTASDPLPFRVLICGGGLPADYQTEIKSDRLSYLGFVEDIEAYVMAADVMVNPILSGGGVKTKVLESIACGTPVVSFAAGAAGIDHRVCGTHLKIVEDENDQGFAEAVAGVLAQGKTETPPEFYERYEWAQTIKPVLEWSRMSDGKGG